MQNFEYLGNALKINKVVCLFYVFALVEYANDELLKVQIHKINSYAGLNSVKFFAQKQLKTTSGVSLHVKV